VRAFVALGSNLNDPAAQVRSAARALGRLPDTGLVRCSSLYRTAPVGITAQPDFINAVCEIETRLAAPALMEALLDIERAHGRQRERPGGPRTLDLDLLLYGDETHHQPGLSVPHPRLHERAFVLYPLHEIAPALVIPGRGRIEDLLPGCAGQGIERLAERAG
jgi:2-amino-4-hydroxy-6-hydroxymethyldihydropteridine diphosphokinase